jgi:hypothetical protein
MQLLAMLTLGQGLTRVFGCPQSALEVKGLHHALSQVGHHEIWERRSHTLQHLQTQQTQPYRTVISSPSHPLDKKGKLRARSGCDAAVMVIC